MTSPRESFVLDGVELNDGTNYILQGFEFGIAPPRFQWISGTDSDGAVLAQESDYDNAEMSVRIRIAPQSSMDTALAKIGTLVDKLYEAQQQPLGLAAVWTPRGSTKSLTAYILAGEVTGIPITNTGDDAGWLLRTPAPVVTLKLYRRPFLYGTEVTNAATVTNTDPVQLLPVAGVTGDVPAEARLVVTDAATQTRRHFEWGLEWRYYNAATPLLIDSDSLTALGGAGTTRAGAYDPGAAGNSVIRATLTTNPLAICSTGNQSHVGTFRVKARIYTVSSAATSSNISVRLSWRDGDGQLRANAYVTPPVPNSWVEVDLGMISIPEKILGTQRWQGQIEAYTAGAPGTDSLDVDYILLIPAGEGYGKARAPITPLAATSFSARDEFDQTAGNLNGKTLPIGGTWVTSGDATDLAVETTGHTAQRTTTSDTNGRTAVAGVSSLTDTVASVDFKWSAVPAGGGVSSIVYARTGHVAAQVRVTSAGVQQLRLLVDTADLLPPKTVILAAGVQYTVAVMALAGGVAAAFLGRAGAAAPDYILVASDPRLATGGSYASGTVSFQDANTSATAVTRNYDNFAAWAAASDAVVFSGRSAEIRHDECQRQDSTGTYYGDLKYRGAHFYLPPAGDENRTSRIIGKARRNDIDLAADDQVADSTTLTLHYRPRWLSPPR